MKEGWKIKKLGEVCNIIGGGTPSKKNSEYYNGNIPWATVRDMNCDFLCHTDSQITKKGLQNSSSNLIKKGEVIIATRVGLGKVCILNQATAINQDLKAIIPLKNNLNREFLFYWYKSLAEKVQNDGVGMTVKGVNINYIKKLPIPIPPLSEQKQIVAILDKAFAAIAQAQAHIEKNIANAKELFQSKLNEIFSQKGDGWEEKTFQDICSVITDGTHQTPKYFDKGYIFLSSKNVTSGKINWENIKYIDEVQHLKMHKRLAPQINDILLAKNGTTGVAAIVDVDKVFDIYVSLALLRPTEIIYPYYLLHFINSSVAKKQFNKRLIGVGVPNLHLKEIRQVVINFPVSIQKQKEIAFYIDKLITETNKIESHYHQKLTNLEELKKSILQKAFSGQLSEPIIKR